MSHHGREGEREYTDNDYDNLATRLSTAASVLHVIAHHVDPKINELQGIADSWLDRNGYESRDSKRRARERRADQLDAKIAQLRAEREKL